MTAATLASLAAVTRSRSSAAATSSVNMELLLLRMVLLVTLVCARDSVNAYCAANHTGATCSRDNSSAWHGSCGVGVPYGMQVNRHGSTCQECCV